MATTTTYYGFDIPQSTDLVKDGATAIATLGQDIDTAMNTALGTKKSGMVLLGTTTFTTAASASISNFADDTKYAFYQLLINITGGTNDADLALRVRANTTDASGTDYQSSRIEVKGTTVTGAQQSNATYCYVGTIDAAASGHSMSSVIIKNLNTNNTITFLFQNGPLSTATDRFATYGAGYFGLTSTTYNGLSLLAGAGTFSGSMAVYGFQK